MPVVRIFCRGSLLPLGLSIFICCIAGTQTLTAQTAISGVINSYTRVLGAGDCPEVIQVADPAAFPVGQRVLLIAMQGGQMEDGDNSDFGRIKDNQLSAGLYDWSTVVAVNGNELSLADPVSPEYDFTQAVQLVAVPVYTDAMVAEALQAQAWDGNTGGVLALEVENRLILTADVDVSGSGFRGAISVQATDDNCNLLTNANDYFYETGNWRGAPKGEGVIASVPAKAYGRGPQVNGGGGANTHNSGGGGGSNVAVGGKGGENREPSFGGCDGFFPGIGAHGLNQWPERWFMGGGGGAGHRNNQGNGSGGNGGGIIVIKAAELEFAGGIIRADGLKGSNNSGDGAGGGGAGGTVVLEIQDVIGESQVSAVGGDGGTVNNLNADRCMGPGGGGSGGQVYSQVVVNALIAGGLAGLTTRSTACPEGNNGAEAGSIGSFVIGGIKQPEPTLVPVILGISGDTLLCPGTSFELVAEIEADPEQELSYQWFTSSGDTWLPLSNDGTFSGVNTPVLQGANLVQNADFYLAVQPLCGQEIRSDSISVRLQEQGAAPEAGFTYQLDGFTARFSNTSQGAQTYEWRITEIPFYSSNMESPEFTFPGYGTYEVILRAISTCGVDSIAQTLVLGGTPIAAFEGSSSGSSCVPFSIQWTDQSQGVFDHYYWQFPGGNPATSQEPNPLVTYSTPGVYDVILIVSGDLGADTLSRTGVVKAFSVPQPAFSFQIEDLIVKFSSTAAEDIRHVWSFGDGQSSQEKDPEHTFPGPGAYDVTLNLQAGSCGQSLTQTILLFPNAIRESVLAQQLQLSPNPSRGFIQFQGEVPGLYPLDISFFAANGQLVHALRQHSPATIDIAALPAGHYWVMLRSRAGHGLWKLVHLGG